MTPKEEKDDPYPAIRDVIAEFVGGNWSSHDQALLQGKLDIFAHELAELICREGSHPMCFYGCRDFDAILIDPEVQ